LLREGLTSIATYWLATDEVDILDIALGNLGFAISVGKGAASRSRVVKVRLRVGVGKGRPHAVGEGSRRDAKALGWAKFSCDG
jgi:hypothetical protein